MVMPGHRLRMARIMGMRGDLPCQPRMGGMERPSDAARRRSATHHRPLQHGEGESRESEQQAAARERGAETRTVP